jgi:predicted RecA/RadA family phage recombinase
MTSTNELGAVCLFDGGIPRTITGKARQDISGGQFVVCSGTAGATAPVSSGANTYQAADIEFCLVYTSTIGSGVEAINGIALADISSGAYGTIATRGAYLVKCGGSVIEGTKVEAIDSNSVQSIGSKALLNSVYAADGNVSCRIPGASSIGRALTGARTAGDYCLVYLNV